MKFTTLLCIALIVLTSATVETPFEKIINGFNRYTLEQPQEKIYVHLDRSHYFTGETIWLKSYLVEGANHEASKLSGTIYVELINESNIVVKQIKQHVQTGSAAGSIFLPDSLRAGNYIIRAYTNWMRNFSDDYFFYRKIQISDFGYKTKPKDRVKDSISIQFFPEGGDLVNGIDSRVAFKAIGTDGLAREIRGKIVDEHENFITSFKSNLLGMGGFMLTPEPSKKYHAVIEGIAEPVALPGAKKEGIALSVINLPGQDKVLLRIQAISYPEGDILLLVQSRGVVSYSPVLKLTAGGIITKLDKSQLPEGISQITILNDQGQPVCERLIYIEKPERKLHVTLTSDKRVYGPREKITMTVDVKDSQHNPVVASMSLSVCDDKQSPFENYRESIYGYLTLSSDLSGHIESPGYYFDDKNTDRHIALDWLLMTQGWRRFTVEQALDYDSHKLTYPSEQGITLTGTMIDKYSKDPIPDGKVTYLGLGSVVDYQEATTRADGKFELRNVVFYDSSRLVLQGETKKGKRWTSFVIDSIKVGPEVNFQFLQERSETSEADQRTQISNASDRKGFDMEYNFDEKTVILAEVKIRGKREIAQENRIYGLAAKTVVVAGDKVLENKLHPALLLQGRHAGVDVIKQGPDYKIFVRRKSAVILVDNMPVSIEVLNSIPVRYIESYDIWKGPEALVFGGQAAIAFYTKKDKSQPYKIEGMFNVSSGGYAVSREFYSPKYDVNNKIDLPDKRATLFWAPNIQTDSTGRAIVSFYNHDDETSVTGILEGITSSGYSGSTTYQYEIKKK